MLSNPTIDTLMEHRSVRKYTQIIPDDEVIETVVRAGQQAPFAHQNYSVLLSRDSSKNSFGAPLMFTICVDIHKFEKIMERRGWKRATNDLTTMLFGIEDASYMAQNMVIAGRSLGLGSCFIGAPLMMPEKIIEKFKLPKGVYPIVSLTMGYPDEDCPTRPRYPMEFTLFENEYPDMNDEMVDKAIKVMDEGYLAQDYYKKVNFMVTLPKGMEEKYTFDDYSWTEHISRKIGIWGEDLSEQIESIRKCGFELAEK